ncbi:FAD-dependent oxidoreductase domain-containing protein 1-like [Prorops nasuta]|uniref:FAD-dependent oxidoreductase domain-containing protein 1-like n=1 Tax=Prorops nasuta TaxID=863751 RepID=UPI0034CEB56C
MLRKVTPCQKYFNFYYAPSAIKLVKSYTTKKPDGNQIDKPNEKSIHGVLKQINRTVDSWYFNLKEIPSSIWKDCNTRVDTFPERCDVLIVGGGAMGSSVAYWLGKKAYKTLSVVVLEKDNSYSTASTTLSVGGIRQQFSVAENIQMSLFGAEFLRNIDEHLGTSGEPKVDICYHPCGYLTLAPEDKAEILKSNSDLQNYLGARNRLLTTKQLKKLFPWLNTDGIELGCLGVQKEGWFDPWLYLQALKKKAYELGAIYVNARLKGFKFNILYNIPDITTESGRFEVPYKAVIETADGHVREIKFAKVIIAAGAESCKISQMLHIGVGENALSVPLPVEPRKRYVYCFHCSEKNSPGINTPLTIDSTGTYFRREDFNGNFLCGRSPQSEDEPTTDNLDVDHYYFENHVWPALANRVKAFENIKVKSSWAGYYEYNTFDQNGIVGRHPILENVYFATGFSGHGIQQSPAVGLAICELILDDKFTSIDLKNFSFNRFLANKPIYEIGII